MATKSCERRSACVGSLRDRVVLHQRTITEPIFGDPDFGEDFEGVPKWASIKTNPGVTQDGNEQLTTHEITVRFDSSVTDESWLQLPDGRRLDVLSVEDLDERHEYMVLLCSDRGKTASSKS